MGEVIGLIDLLVPGAPHEVAEELLVDMAVHIVGRGAQPDEVDFTSTGENTWVNRNRTNI